MAIFRTSPLVSEADPALPHLVLVGLPGSGKTTIGRAVAAELGRSFLDFDDEIERRAGVSVAEIFSSLGEAHFRNLERRLTDELRAVGNCVLAPGGGWVANPGCVAALRPPAMLVYLQLDPARALKRMAGDVVVRPLLRTHDPGAAITKLLHDREPLYLLADHTVKVDFMPPPKVIASIVALARRGGQD